MTIAELRKIIKLCRQEGVELIEMEGVKLVLGSPPAPKKARGVSKKTPVSSDPLDIYQQEELTEEQLLNWSVTSDFQGETS